MRCENCGGPIEQDDVERGTCTHCGAVLDYVLRAAEKAEIVRRVVAQGNSVRIDGDRVEASAARRKAWWGGDERTPWGTQQTRAMITASAGVAAMVLGIATYVGISRPQPRAVAAIKPAPAFVEPPATPTPPLSPATESDPLFLPPPAEPTAATTSSEAETRKPVRHVAAAPSTVNGVIAAHRPQYQRCERDELGRNASAPRRYSLAITVGPSGQVEWVEVLSEVSQEMKSCIETVTRGLLFPRPPSGSTRSFVMLSLAAPS